MIKFANPEIDSINGHSIVLVMQRADEYTGWRYIAHIDMNSKLIYFPGGRYKVDELAKIVEFVKGKNE